MVSVSKQRRILVLGGSGMLGRACAGHLRATGLGVDHTDRRAATADWRIDVRHDLPRLWTLLRREAYELVVNAIGVLRAAMPTDRADAIRDGLLVNAVFPHDLVEHAAETRTRVIHISTDAVFAGRREAPFDEGAAPAPADQYAASKWLGEPSSPAALTVRCSVIGRSADQASGLVDWFLALPRGARVQGYRDYRWTASTTLQVARLVEHLADRETFDRLRALSPVFHYAPNPSITKLQLLEMLADLQRRDVVIQAVGSPKGSCDLSLTTQFVEFRRLSTETRPWPAVLSEILR